MTRKTSDNFRAIINKIWGWFGTTLAWRIIISLLAVQSAFVALTGRYSMAFDEYYHLGLIKLYSLTWLPWQVRQPDGLAELGAVETNSSFFYHYLMSLPYRVIQLFTNDQTIQIIALRLIDVAIVVVGFYIFRRLLLVLGTTKSTSHIILLIVSIIPMTTFLAGQLTYDSLFFTATGLVALLFVEIFQTIKARQKLSLAKIWIAFAVLTFASLIKYAFLPMTLAIATVAAVFLISDIRHAPGYYKKTFASWKKSWLSHSSLAGLGFLIVALSFFVASDGRNLVTYHTPNPSCDRVLGIERCLGYDPWRRDYNYIRWDLPSKVTSDELVKYPSLWLEQMMYESYFSVGPREILYAPGDPLPVPYKFGWVLLIAATVVILFGSIRIWRRGVVARLVLAIVITYVAVLFLQNLTDYQRTGVRVAIHGRYVLHLLPLIGYLAYTALTPLPGWLKRRDVWLKLAVLTLALGLFYTGGVTSYIIRSWDEWIWPYAVDTLQQIRSLLWPWIIK